MSAGALADFFQHAFVDAAVKFVADGAGKRKQARDILKQLLTGKNYVSPGELAVLYAALGEREKAFASLEDAHARRDLQLQYLNVDPAFDSLREDSRFQDLLRRMNFPS